MATFTWTLPSAPTTSLGTTGGSASADLSAEQLQERQFGTDIKFENDYDITSAGDYLLLSGLENLRAAVYRRLLTNPGEYKLVPDYGVGMKRWVKKPDTSANRAEMKTIIEQQLLRDPRIQEIVQIAIESLENQPGVKVGIVLRANGRALRFRPFTFTELE